MTKDELRRHCWTFAIHAAATSFIFDKRAMFLQLRLRMLTFLGVAVPASVGFLVSAVGTDSDLVGWGVVTASVLGGIQLVASIWALVARWEDGLAYSVESMNDNSRIHDRYSILAKTPPGNMTEFQHQVGLLDASRSMRDTADLRQRVTAPEKRAGMRHALRLVQRTCAACKQVPTSMTATECGVCGNFKIGRFGRVRGEQ